MLCNAKKTCLLLIGLGSLLFGCRNEDTSLSDTPALTLTPDPIQLKPERATPSAVTTQTVTIKNDAEAPVRIERIRLTSDLEGALSLVDVPSLPLDLAPGQSTHLDVRLLGSGPESADSKLVVESPDLPRGHVSAQIQPIQPAAMRVCVELTHDDDSRSCGPSPEIAFGRLQVGRPYQARVQIQSIGVGALTLQRPRVFGAVSGTFRVENETFPQIIPSGDHFSFILTFTPQTEEEFTGTLRLESNAEDRDVVELTISGESTQIGLCDLPRQLAFSDTTPGEVSEEILTLTNCLDEAVTVENLTVSGDAFQLSSPPTPNEVLAPNESRPLNIEFAPTQAGNYSGVLSFKTSEGFAFVELLGFSTSCRLQIPSALSFVGQYDTKTIRLVNQSDQVCRIESLEFVQENASFNYSTVNPGSFPLDIAPGGRAQFQINFESPNQLGSRTAVDLGITYRNPTSNEASVTRYIMLNSRPMTLGEACNPTPHTTDLSFGNVAVGTRMTTGFEVEYFSAVCIESISLTTDTSTSFQLEVSSDSIRSRGVTITFEAGTAGRFDGMLVIQSKSDAQPVTEVSLTGYAGAPQLCIDTKHVDFGSVSTQTATRTLTLEACGEEAVTITDLEIDSTSSFSLDDDIQLPFDILPGDSTTVPIHYLTGNADPETSVLRVESNASSHPEIKIRLTQGASAIPAEAGQHMYFMLADSAFSHIMRVPLQGDIENFEPVAPSFGTRTTVAQHGCGGCHALSPDGRYNIYGYGDPFDLNMSFIDHETEHAYRMPDDMQNIQHISWNPDVHTTPPYQFAYESQGDIHIASLYAGYIGPLDGASDPDIVETMPSWGPDGEIAFVRGASIMPGTEPVLYPRYFGASDLCVVNEAGGTPRHVTGASGGDIGRYHPKYSPDGSWIAFTQSRTKISALMPLDGQVRWVATNRAGTIHQLESDVAQDTPSTTPNWSIDGRYLSFSSVRPDGVGGWDVYIVPIDFETGLAGSAFQVPGLNTVADDIAAAWSP